ncbi:carboxypeptidase regulatory-like domain-containing protein [Paraferrimonas sp. SM1919]|uniref:carboxypeptidase regulatory-like domain-containing protein n=1 Tax=Paraferrimonas sp. SM1919 TaxID=2662263 RepID=UPI0013D16340|nr:carboxypeptidase regulatory-like domain-containing protein [Paraferrimonas sp. SM1919]
MLITKRLLTAAFVLLFSACSGEAPTESEKTPVKPLTVTTTFDKSEACSLGGVLTTEGDDANNNGQLESSEITRTTETCNEPPVSSTMTIKGIISPDLVATINSEQQGIAVEGFGFGHLLSSFTELFSNTDEQLATTTASQISIVPQCVEGIVEDSSAESTDEQTSPQEGEITLPLTTVIPITTDEQGNYEAEVPLCDDYDLVVVDSANEQGVIINPVIPIVDGSDVFFPTVDSSSLSPTGTVSLNIVSVTEQVAVANAQVTFRELNQSISSNAQGQVTLRNAPEGSYTLTIEHNDYASRAIDFRIEAGTTTELVDIGLHSDRGHLAGQVSGEGLNLSAGFTVYARAADGSIFSTITDENGFYTLANLPVGEGYSVIAKANDFEIDKVDNLRVEKDTTRNVPSLSLMRQDSQEPIGSLAGYARFANRGDMEHAGIIVSIEGTDKEAITARDGSYVFNQLSAGSYTINYTDSNHVSFSTNIQVHNNLATTLDAVELLSFAGSLSGKVVDTAGAAVVEQAVLLSPIGVTVVTDADGFFRFSGVPVGAYFVEINKQGYGAVSLPVNITEESKNGEVVLEESINLVANSLSGLVVSSGVELDGVIVSLVGAADSQTVQTDSEGRFILLGVAPAEYQLQVSKTGYKSFQMPLVMPEIEHYDLPLPIEIEPQMGVVKGNARLPHKSDHSDILVKVRGTDYQTFTDSSGDWSLQLPVGNYADVVIFSKALYSSITYDSTVVVNEVGDFITSNMTLEQTHARVKFEVTTVNQCPSNIRVDVTDSESAHKSTFVVSDNYFNEALPLGLHRFEIYCPESGWETAVSFIDLDSGVELVELSAIKLRQSYVIINDGAEFTNNKLVYLTIGHEEASEMQISVNGTLQQAWKALESEALISLDDEDGLQQVSVEFRNSNEELLQDEVDEIVLDTQIHVDSFVASTVSTMGDELVLTLNLGETGAMVKAHLGDMFSNLNLNDDGVKGDAVAEDGIYSAAYIIDRPFEIDFGVTALINDRAGNEMQVVSNALNLSTAPSVVNLKTSSSTSNRSVVFDFHTNEPASSVLLYGISADALSNTQVINETYTSNHLVTLGDLTPSSELWYRIIVTDKAGNEGERSGKVKMAPDRVEGLSAHPGDSEIGLLWQHSSKSDIAGYRIYRSSSAMESPSLVNTSQLVRDNYYSDQNLQNGTTYRYFVTAVDSQENESLTSLEVNGIPFEHYAGPTLVEGGLVDSQWVWLKSRSPYQLTANLRIEPGASLTLMPGTVLNMMKAPQVAEGEETRNTARYIEVDGQFRAYGTEDDKVEINRIDLPSNFSTTGESSSKVGEKSLILFRHAHLKQVTTSSRTKELVHLDSATVKIAGDVGNQMFYADKVANSTLTAEVIIEQESTCTNDETNLKESCIALSVSSYGDYYLNSILDSQAFATGISEENANKVRQGQYTSRALSLYADVAHGVDFKYGHIQADTIEQSNIAHSVMQVKRLLHNEIIDSQIWPPFQRKLQNANYNVIDEISYFASHGVDGYEDTNFASNYWSTHDIADIMLRTNYKTTGASRLYPVISSSNIENADFDSDGIPDRLDPDNDNDGYADVQEEKLSSFGLDYGVSVIFSPLDPNSHPNGAIDTDGDGITDDEDEDIDGDGISNVEELELGLNPVLTDTDGDGVSDNQELSLGTDPLNSSSKPVNNYTNGLVIGSHNSNSNNEFVISGESILSNCVVEAGTTLLLDLQEWKDITFDSCRFEGEFGKPIVIKGHPNIPDDENLKSSDVYIVDSQVDYLVLKNDIEVIFRVYTSEVKNSELNAAFAGYYSNSSVVDSYIDTARFNKSYIEHSKILNTSIFNGTVVKDSYYGSTPSSGWEVEGSFDGVVSDIGVVTSKHGMIDIKNSLLFEDFYFDVYSYQQTRFTDTDIYNFPSRAGESFYDGVAIAYDGVVIDYAKGLPDDNTPDGILSTVITNPINGDTNKLDGLLNPRTSLNFPNGVRDLWDMRYVGTGLVEPGAPTLLIEQDYFYSLPISPDQTLKQMKLTFSADGGVVYECYSAEVGDIQWLRDIACDNSGFWHIAHSGFGKSHIAFDWTGTESVIGNSIDIVYDEQGQVDLSSLGFEKSQLDVPSTNVMYAQGFDYYRMSGVLTLENRFGYAIPLLPDLKAVVKTSNGDVVMPVDHDTGYFGFAGWLDAGQLNSTVTVSIFVDSDDNGLQDDTERSLGYGHFDTELVFGTFEQPMILRNMDTGIGIEDLIGNTYYLVTEDADNSHNMTEITFVDESKLGYRFFKADFGASEWLHLGSDCELVGCQPTKKDVSSASYQYWLQSEMHTSTAGGETYSYYGTTLKLNIDGQNWYLIASLADVFDDKVEMHRQASAVLDQNSRRGIYSFYNELPQVPKHRSDMTYKLADIGFVESFVGGYIISPKRAQYIDNNQQLFNTWNYEELYLSEIHAASVTPFYGWRNDNIAQDWGWGFSVEERRFFPEPRYSAEGLLSFGSEGSNYRKIKIVAIDQENPTWVLQHDNAYPRAYFQEGGISFDNNGKPELDVSTYKALDVSAITGKVWVNHLIADKYIEMSFNEDGSLSYQELQYNGSEWIAIGDMVFTQWTETETGQLQFSLGDTVKTMQLLFTNDDVSALWDVDYGESQVWLPTRPAMQN